MNITDEMIEAACRAHTPQFDRMDPAIRSYARDQMRAAITAALSASPAPVAARDWAMVPREPTPEMIGAWYRYKNGHHWPDEPPPRDTSDYGAYRAMLAAAPAQPAAEPVGYAGQASACLPTSIPIRFHQRLSVAIQSGATAFARLVGGFPASPKQGN